MIDCFGYNYGTGRCMILIGGKCDGTGRCGFHKTKLQMQEEKRQTAKALSKRAPWLLNSKKDMGGAASVRIDRELIRKIMKDRNLDLTDIDRGIGKKSGSTYTILRRGSTKERTARQISEFLEANVILEV